MKPNPLKSVLPLVLNLFCWTIYAGLLVLFAFTLGASTINFYTFSGLAAGDFY